MWVKYAIHIIMNKLIEKNLDRWELKRNNWIIFKVLFNMIYS